jgi:hypothetical protein
MAKSRCSTVVEFAELFRLSSAKRSVISFLHAGSSFWTSEIVCATRPSASRRRASLDVASIRQHTSLRPLTRQESSPHVLLSRSVTLANSFITFKKPCVKASGSVSMSDCICGMLIVSKAFTSSVSLNTQPTGAVAVNIPQ